MKQFPISSLSEICCLKLKDKVFVSFNLLIILFFKSAEELFIEIKYMIVIFNKKSNLFGKINL